MKGYEPKGYISAWCRNLLCHRRPSFFKIGYFDKNCNKIRCPDCGFVGYMPAYHVVNFDTMIEQIVSWRDILLYRECFRLINFDKLPGTLQIQRLKKK
jgi:hypothetical protein